MMSKWSYLLERALRMDWQAMLRTTRQLSRETGHGVTWLLADMAHCARDYGAGYMDYRIAEMYRLTPAQRATQITRAVSNRIVGRMNDKAYWHHFDDKAEFNTLFAQQVRRDWIDLRQASPEAFTAWTLSRGPVAGKPVCGSSGQGIVRFLPGTLPSVEALQAQGIDLLEEWVTQHPKLDSLCSTSVNTLRVATLLGDRREGVVYAYLRIGNGEVVDNVDRGGMAAPIDLDTGVLTHVGADKAGGRFTRHPQTGAMIPGFEVPYWQEAQDMALAAMRVVPQVRFVAWDIAITQQGPVFIEGNSFPSHAIPQFAAHFPDGIGILPRFQEFIDIP